MDKSTLMVLVIVLLFTLLALMAFGWRNRRRRQASLPEPRRVDGVTGTVRFSVDAHYVATTMAADPLDRVAVGGLGFRARASITVTDLGLVLGIPGQDPVWLPSEEISGVDRATWTIDRVVERDGLVLLAWQLIGPDHEAVDVHSYLRFDTPAEAADFISAVTALLDPHTTSSAPPPQGGTA